jgi:hypothetical protein
VLPPLPVVSAQRVHGGAQALLLVDKGSDGIGLQSWLYPALPGGRYRATCFAFAESGAGRLYLEFHRDRGTRLHEVHAETAAIGQWLALSLEAEAPPATAYVSCLVYSTISNVGVSCFDDVALTGPAGRGTPLKFERRKVDMKALCTVGSEKQLLLDELFFARSANVTLRVQPARKSGERNLVADRPWENFVINWLTVLADEGRYRMWYECYDRGYKGDQDARYAYAESRDGIRWEKPSLGLVDYAGSRDNNLIWARLDGKPTHGAGFFKDPTAPPEQRYKTLFLSGNGVAGGFSADGLRWQAYASDAILPVGSDTQQVGFWDPGIGKYVAYCRLWTRGRTIGRAESDDFTRFPGAEEVLRCDDRDPPENDLYNSACMRYPCAAHAYFIFTSRYDHPSDKLHIQLATSRDGVNWQRPDRTAFVPTGGPNDFDAGHLYMGLGHLRVGDELWHYYQSYTHTHNQQVPANVTGGGTYSRLIVRLDRYIGAEAGADGGWFETLPLTFAGARLELNAQVRPGGTLRVGLLEGDGRPIAGYGVGECEPVLGDQLAATVRWAKGADLSGLAGRPISLRVEMLNASLYAFQFCR